MSYERAISLKDKRYQPIPDEGLASIYSKESLEPGGMNVFN
jgi:hypothetical protein